MDGDRRGQAAAGGQNGKQALTEMVMAVGIRVCIGRRSCVRRVEARDALLYCECVRCPIAGGKDEVGAVAPGRKAGVRWACAPWGRALRLRPTWPDVTARLHGTQQSSCVPGALFAHISDVHPGDHRPLGRRRQTLGRQRQPLGQRQHLTSVPSICTMMISPRLPCSHLRCACRSEQLCHTYNRCIRRRQGRVRPRRSSKKRRHCARQGNVRSHHGRVRVATT